MQYSAVIVCCNRFVQKVYTLDPTTDAIPWNYRGYSRKRKPLSSQFGEETEEAKRLQLTMVPDSKTDEATGKDSKDTTSGRYVGDAYVRMDTCFWIVDCCITIILF